MFSTVEDLDQVFPRGLDYWLVDFGYRYLHIFHGCFQFVVLEQASFPSHLPKKEESGVQCWPMAYLPYKLSYS